MNTLKKILDDLNVFQKGIQNYQQIERLIDRGLTESTWKHLINPASLDVTIGDKVLWLKEENLCDKWGRIHKDDYPNSCYFDKRKSNTITDNIGNTFYEYYLENEIFPLLPNNKVLLCTQQYFVFPSNISGELYLKSSKGRNFYDHVKAVWVDCGFEGRLTLEIVNHSNVVLPIKKGMRLCQIVFHRHNHSNRPYQGKYQGDISVSVSKEVGNIYRLTA